MTDDKNVNPHTGQPVPDDPKPSAGPRELFAGSPGPDPARLGAPAPAKPTGLGASDPAYEVAAQAPSFAKAQEAATAAPSQQELAIRSALEIVMDPEINLSVIELGLIREVKIEPEQVQMKMILTTPFCPYGPAMLEMTRSKASESAGKPAVIELGMEIWDPSMMEEGAGAAWGF